MPTKQTKPVPQEIVIIMDKSGSMAQSREDVIGGFNTYISDLKADKSIAAKLTLIMFDNGVHKLYGGKKLADVDELSQATYNPNGGTALNDAVMTGIKDVEDRLKKSKAKIDPQVLVIVFTDGEENSSREFSKKHVSDKRAEKEKEDWAFIFMGADMDAWSASSGYGMSAGNTVGLGRTCIATSASYLANRTSKAAKSYGMRSAGLMSEESYSNSVLNMMSIDEDDLKNDQAAVTMRKELDDSAKVTKATDAGGNVSLQQLGNLIGITQLGQVAPTQKIGDINPKWKVPNTRRMYSGKYDYEAVLNDNSKEIKN